MIVFVVAVILKKVHYEHEISLIKDAKLNQHVHFIR